MKNIYYLLWADAIKSIKEHHPNKKDWKWTLLLMNSFVHGLNVWIIIIWLKYFNIYSIPFVDFDFFPGDMIDDFLLFFIYFMLPFFVLNYFLVFHNKRYERILEKYATKKSGYAINYSLLIIFLAFASTIFYSSFR